MPQRKGAGWVKTGKGVCAHVCGGHCDALRAVPAQTRVDLRGALAGQVHGNPCNSRAGGNIYTCRPGAIVSGHLVAFAMDGATGPGVVPTEVGAGLGPCLRRAAQNQQTESNGETGYIHGAAGSGAKRAGNACARIASVAAGAGHHDRR